MCEVMLPWPSPSRSEYQSVVVVVSVSPVSVSVSVPSELSVVSGTLVVALPVSAISVIVVFDLSYVQPVNVARAMIAETAR